MIKVMICGIGGQMGGRLAHLSLQSDDLRIVAGVEAAGHPGVGKDVGEVIGARRLDAPVVDDIAKVIDRGDVVLAFTAPPEGTVTASEVVGKAGKAMVVGTTGMSDAQLSAFKKNVANIPCVFASNYTAGVTILTRLVEEAARILGDACDVEVVEMHHHFKKDAPSGTALTLADAAARGLERNLKEVAVYGREGIVGARKREEIGIHAVRGGDIVGDHTVMFIGSGERIEFVHRVQSRDAFASGALRAVRFAVKAKTGLYGMRDVLGIQ